MLLRLPASKELYKNALASVHFKVNAYILLILLPCTSCFTQNVEDLSVESLSCIFTRFSMQSAKNHSPPTQRVYDETVHCVALHP